MNKFFFGLIFMSFLMSACKGQPNSKIWTKKYEQGLYNYLDSSSKPFMPDGKKRLKYIEFIIARLKQEVPNGLNSVSKDSLHSLNIKIGREYAFQEYGTGNSDITPYYTPWSPLIEKTFRDDYIAVFQNKYPSTANKFCDCIIKKLKTIYPDSILVPLPKDINLKVTMECKSILKAP
jgi:hypothetical protein